MNKVSGANVRRLLNLCLLKAGLKGCFFARVGDYLPCFCLHLSSPRLIAAPHDIYLTRRSSSPAETIFSQCSTPYQQVLGS
jgi:hypothetical protein